MILSRVWYVILGAAVAVALYVVFVAVGQYNRQTTLSLKEGLASDSQTVEWALKIDARRRLDALIGGSVESGLQQALIAADAVKADAKVPDKSRADAKKSLTATVEAIPADWRPDALFAVDRDGHVVAQVGFESMASSDEFELGGYPAVNDALHGWVRDDVWLLGSKLYVVSARPVEYDVTQRPAGAIVGLREVNDKFAADLAKRARTNVAFFVAGQKVAGGVGVDGFDAEKLDAVGADLKNVNDKTYNEAGRTDVRMFSDDLGAMYDRLAGDVWTLDGGFAVVRGKTTLAGPMSFLSNADDKDKANVPWVLLVGIVLGAAAIGVLFTVFEHTNPLRELVMQAERLKSGAMDGLQVARFRGAYRLAAQSLNQGMERSIEKAGGVTRKPADLESILGPAPAQPSMSAFSFPMAPGGDNGAAAIPPVPPAAPSAPLVAPPAPMPAPAPIVPAAGSPVGPPRPAISKETPPVIVPTVPSNAGRPPPAAARPVPPPAAARAPGLGLAPVKAPPAAAARPQPPLEDDGDEDATMVGAVPAELMAQATGGAGAEEAADWRNVYEDFLRTKKQCGEPTDGLTFDKFSHTLKKNRDALISKHGCKRVKFSVYVKEGRASLKATPVRE
ncbi:MAG TPA: MXAN_5187 family protein [Polyangiaceae bacterium]|jgi:hypothetical protein|nr:MXAN_5187 family protein [Polyangiaceae bacterium]